MSDVQLFKPQLLHLSIQAPFSKVYVNRRREWVKDISRTTVGIRNELDKTKVNICEGKRVGKIWF